MECGLTAFDYLHGERRPWFQSLCEPRIPERLQAPILAVALALLTAAASWAVEVYRLHSALDVERAYQIRLQDSERAVAATKVHLKGLEERAALDRRIVEIRESGGAEALRLTDIANHVPANAWLSAIAKDASGISIEGSAVDLRALAGAIDRLSRAREVRNPILLSADEDGSGNVKRHLLRYRVRMEPVE